MYILHRYLAQSYLKIFSLSVLTFILVLLVSRFKEIARFAALSSDLSQTALFVAYQVPLILPIAIPLSAFIASLLLFGRLSRTLELTALRSSGISLSSILAPLLLLSLLLSLLNFSFSAKIAPFCRRETKSLLYYETSSNPLLLLQRQNLVKLKKSYVKMKAADDGKSAKNLILITHNQSSDRLSLISAKKLRMKDSSLVGTDVAIISHLGSEKADLFDPLIIENEASVSTDASALSSHLKKHRPRLEAAALEFPMLRLSLGKKGKFAKKAFVEMLRRITLSLSAFSFTLLGCAFGIEQGRSPTKKHLFIAISLALLLMMSYLFGKGLKSSPLIALFVFALPHPIIWIASLLRTKHSAKGI